MTTVAFDLTDSHVSLQGRRIALIGHDHSLDFPRHSDQRVRVVCDCRSLEVVGGVEVAFQALVEEDCEIQTYLVR